MPPAVSAAPVSAAAVSCAVSAIYRCMLMRTFWKSLQEAGQMDSEFYGSGFAAERTFAHGTIDLDDEYLSPTEDYSLRSVSKVSGPATSIEPGTDQ